MKLNDAGFGRFLKRPDSNIYGALIFGNDAGKVSKHIENLKQCWLGTNQDPFAESIYSSGQLAASGNRLLDEMAAYSLMGGDRLIHIKSPNAEEGKAIIAAVKGFDNDKTPPPVAHVLVEAGQLPASSALRKAFETGKTHSFSLACYPDQMADVSRIAREVLADAGHKIDPSALALLCDCVPKDRRVLYMELDKLLLYMRDQEGAQITPEHVRAIIASAGQSSIDDLVFSCADGNAKGADIALQRSLDSGQAPVMIVRAIARHLFRMHDVLASAKNGGSIQSATAKLRPPIFIMHRDRFIRGCALWSIARLETAIRQALDTEKTLKSASGIDQSLLGRFVLAVSSLAK